METAIPLRTYVRWALALTAVVVVVGGLIQLTGTADGDPPAATGEQAVAMDEVDELERAGDCSELQRRLHDARDTLGPPGSEEHSRRATLMRYTEDAMERIDCDVTVRLQIDNDGPLAGSTRSAAY